MFQQKKNITYRQNTTKLNNQTDINNIKNTDYISLLEDNKKNDSHSSGKLMKKNVSQKIYNLKDIKNDASNEDEEFEEKNKEQKNKFFFKKNQREMIYEGNERNSMAYLDYNMYNINLNFISDKNNILSNIDYINSGNIFNLNTCNSSLINNRPSSILIQKKEKGLINKNIGFYESSNNNKIYSSQIIKKNKNLKTQIKEKKIDNSLDSFSNIIEKKNYMKKPISNIINNELKNSNKTNENNLINNQKDNIIQLEDLLILEGKFCHLFDCLKYENHVPKICVEWWNFYNYSSFFGKFHKLFPKSNGDNNINSNYILSDYQIAHDAVMYELLSMIITYKILCCPSNKNLINNLISLINEVNQNFLIECDYILSKVSIQSLNNIWVKKLKNIILDKKNWKEDNSKENNNFHLNCIKRSFCLCSFSQAFF